MSTDDRPGTRADDRLRIVWIYPDLLSTYGDRGNMLILARRADLRGHAGRDASRSAPTSRCPTTATST